MTASLQPQRLLPAAWAHPSWLAMRRPPSAPRQLRLANLALLQAMPALAVGDPQQLGRLGVLTRPALVRFCRAVCACAAMDEVRRMVGAEERRRLARLLGAPLRDALQAMPVSSRVAVGDCLPWPREDDLITTVGARACLCVAPPTARAWLRIRLPRPLLLHHADAPDGDTPDIEAMAGACLDLAWQAWSRAASC